MQVLSLDESLAVLSEATSANGCMSIIIASACSLPSLPTCQRLHEHHYCLCMFPALTSHMLTAARASLLPLHVPCPHFPHANGYMSIIIASACFLPSLPTYNHFRILWVLLSRHFSDLYFAFLLRCTLAQPLPFGVPAITSKPQNLASFEINQFSISSFSRRPEVWKSAWQQVCVPSESPIGRYRKWSQHRKDPSTPCLL